MSANEEIFSFLFAGILIGKEVQQCLAYYIINAPIVGQIWLLTVKQDYFAVPAVEDQII
jgi:hypothetical protein